MAFFAQLCTCYSSSGRKRQKESTRGPPPHLDIQPSQPSNYNRYQPFVDENDPYHSSQPLPRYTARPISIQEKTLAFSGRQSISDREYPRDEKSQLETTQGTYDQRSPAAAAEDDSSDASSQISFPSSLGNTSTATGETPPPPYSYCSSRAHSHRSMSISISVTNTGMTETDTSSIMTPSPIATPPPVFHRDHTGGSRRSCEGRRSRDDPTLPDYTRS
ncbi:hypothetical protein FQN49_000450 [Arthroderma sp. PD_2]|nr:hypothetical protein FQN49_000450 [Arthroderma sp. PD_2]